MLVAIHYKIYTLVRIQSKLVKMFLFVNAECEVELAVKQS